MPRWAAMSSDGGVPWRLPRAPACDWGSGSLPLVAQARSESLQTVREQLKRMGFDLGASATCGRPAAGVSFLLLHVLLAYSQGHRRSPVSQGTGARRCRRGLPACARELRPTGVRPAVHVGTFWIPAEGSILATIRPAPGALLARKEGGISSSSPSYFGVWRGELAHRRKAELVASRSIVPGCESHSLINTSSNTPANASALSPNHPRYAIA